MPPEIAKVNVCVLPELTMLALPGRISSSPAPAPPPMIVIVADVVPPIESNTLRVTVPAATLAGIVTVIVEKSVKLFQMPPSDPSLIPLSAIPPPAPSSLNAFVGSDEVVIYGVFGLPEMVNISVWGVSPLTTVTDGGDI